jgi:metallo-beta-lactamase family protein
MLRDSGHIQESDVAYLNKKRARKGDPPLEPLYTAADAAEATRLLEQRQYDRPFEPVPGVLVTFVDAGHILGSAGVVLDLEENGRKLRLMFSGDIGRRDLPLLRDPVLPQDVDVLIMESTYGDRSHESPEQAFEQFQQVVKRTVDRGGKVIIPAFAVGRTQTLVYCLHQMIDHNDIPRIPVFVDSPLAINITAVFREYPQYFDQEAKHFLEQDPHGTIFGFDLIRYTPSVEESKAINEYDGPAVIISASGMAEVGRILHHLKNNIEEARNSVLITSWMAPHTLGRRLLEGEKKVKIFGEQYRVRADVVTLNGLSAHAGREPLIDYALASKGRLKKVFLVHGEARAAEPLMQSLSERGLDVSFPALGDRFEM